MAHARNSVIRITRYATGDRLTLEKPNLVVYSGEPPVHAAIAERFPEVACTITDDAERMTEAATAAEIIFMARAYEREMVLSAPRLKWLHLAGAGIDRLRPLDELPPCVSITHTPSINANMMADYVMCIMSMLTWNLPRIVKNQQQAQWQRWPVERLEGKSLLLIGLGKVGTAVAERAQTARMSLIGVRRRPRPADDFSEIVGPDKLLDVLPEADFVVICAPLTTETEGMIGREALRVMKDSAYLINVSRGAIIDEAALEQALQDGRLAGAALDVFVEEPLPAKSNLWRLPNLIISPHISALSHDYHQRALHLFCENLKRFLVGEQLKHVIDRSQEY